MKTSLLKTTSLLCIIGLLTACAPEDPLPVSLIPQPSNIVAGRGSFRLDNKLCIAVSDQTLQDQAVYLQSMIKASTGFNPEIRDQVSGKCISLMLDSSLEPSLGSEGYEFRSGNREVEIRAAGRGGIFYGIQTLLQLLPEQIYSKTPVEGTEWRLPALEITDKPRFAWRGFMLDVSRHFFPIEYLHRVVDQMAVHKLNRLQLHLTDDQGWRIEIRKYPNLTETGAWRVDREDRHWNSREVQKPGEKATYGGFYTQDEIRNLVRYAAERNIVIVPEIEIPAHATAALASYPELTCTGEPLTVLPGGIWPCNNIFCAGKEETFKVIEDILTEVIELFPSEYIHIGGDEADKSRWVACPLCQKRMKAENLKDEKELQSYFIRRVEQFINSKGRQLIGWDEILEGGLAPNAAVMSWRGTQGGIEAARAGHPVVMTPTSHCYLDYYQGNPESEPLAIGGYLPLDKVYSYEPVPAELNEQEARMVLGVQGNLWTEYVGTPEHADYMTYPRLTALAETGWSDPARKDFTDFTNRLDEHLKRLDILGVNYSMSHAAVDILPGYNSQTGKVEISLRSGSPGTEIRFTIDGSDPLASGTIYGNPFSIDKTSLIRAAAFREGKALSAVSEKKVRIHLATGKPVRYLIPWSPKYSGGGESALVNGIRGTINSGDGTWQGFEGTDLIVEIDLGEPVTVSRMALGALHSIGSWIFFPESVEFLVGTDSGNLTSAGTVENTADLKDGARLTRDFELTVAPVKARFVKVHARSIRKCPDWHAGKGGPAWLFTDEIIVE